MMFRLFLRIVNNRYFALTCIIGFLVPFIIFSFWNHLSVDDYFIGIRKQTNSFWSIQSFYYNNWHGRYVSILSTSIVVFTNLLYSKTGFIGIYFISATLLSFYFLCFQVNRYLLQKYFSTVSLFLIAGLLLIAELNFIPEPVTAFYWFSGAITYQQPLIFLMLFLGSFLGVFFNKKIKILYSVITIILLICMQGYNEMFTIWFLLNTTILVAYYIYKEHSNKLTLIFLMLLNYVTACIMLFAPGNFHRAALFDNSSIPTILSLSISKFLIINWFFLKEPIWWFFLLLLYSNESVKQRLLLIPFFTHLKNVKLINYLSLYFALGVITYFPVLYVSNGSMPFRMENQICLIFSITLLLMFYIRFPNNNARPNHTILYLNKFVILSVLIFCTSNMKNVSQTLLSGFFYNKVMEQRVSQLKNASLMNVNRFTVDNYDISVQKKIDLAFPKGTKKTLKEIMIQKPSLLFFSDDLAYSEYRVILQNFYKIDTIIVNNNSNINK